MKNLLFIVPSLRRGGAETQVIDLVNNLDTSKYRLHILSFSPRQDQLDRIDKSKVSYHHALRRSRFDLSFIPRIATVIKDNDIDLVHCTLQFAFLVAWLARFWSGRKPELVPVIHTTINKGMKEELQDKLLYQWLMRGCRTVLFVCDNQKQYWVKKYSYLDKRAKVIHNGVDTDYFSADAWQQQGRELRQQYGIADNDCVLACIAGFRKEKAHDILVDAVSAVEGVHLLLAGDGETRLATEKLVEQKQLGHRVHFLGLVSEVRPVIAASDATVLASTAVETFSIAMLESMSMSTPMIATDIGGMSEAIINNDTGWLIQPGDRDELVSVITALVNDRENLAVTGQNARQKVMNAFSLQLMADKTEIVIDELLG